MSVVSEKMDPFFGRFHVLHGVELSLSDDPRHEFIIVMCSECTSVFWVGLFKRFYVICAFKMGKKIKNSMLIVFEKF